MSIVPLFEGAFGKAIIIPYGLSWGSDCGLVDNTFSKTVTSKGAVGWFSAITGACVLCRCRGWA